MSNVITIQKRDQTKQSFDAKKIYNAVLKAFKEVPPVNMQGVETVTDYVVQVLESYPNETISIETIQDVVEVALIHLDFPKVAKKYILFRDQKTKERTEKEKILDTDHLHPVSKKFTVNQLNTLKLRYLICDVWYTLDEEGKRKENRKAKEQPNDMFERVAKTLAIGDLVHGLQVPSQDIYHQTKPVKDFNSKVWGNKFYEINWPLFNKYNLNPYQAARMLYLFEQIGSFSIHPILENVELGGEYYGLKIGEQLAAKFEDAFGDQNGDWKKYYNRMINDEYMFNTPVLMNFGRSLGGGNACFVLSMKDDLRDIMYTTSVRCADIYKKAGGVGVNVSNTRPEGDIVGDIQGGASGPISWLKAIDDTTEIVKSGTGRRGANMGILEYWHPDITKFINCKKVPKFLENFNISVGLDQGFWDRYFKGENFDLINPRDKKNWGQINSVEFFDNIADSAHKSAEPGLLFFDNANKFNPFKELYGPLRCTNPCGEQYLYPNDSCTLGSVNCAKFVGESGGFDFERFEEACKELTRGLDNVVSLSDYPDDLIEETTKSFRRIGIGVMGVADALYKMRIGYNTKEGYETMSAIAESMHRSALEESIQLAMQRGQAPNWKKLVQITGKKGIDLVQQKVEGQVNLSQRYVDSLNTFGIRNCWVGTEAPTGTIAMITNCSHGIEPVFGLFYEKRLDDQKTKFYFWNEHFIQALKEEGIYSQELLDKVVANYSSCEGIDEIPDWIKKVFVTAITMHWGDHVMAQAVWQKYVDNSISKTINMPSNATVDDVKQAYILAHSLNCKGLSIYVDKSRHEQILHIESTKDALRLQPSDFIKNYVQQNLPTMKHYLPTFFNMTKVGNDWIEQSMHISVERDPITGVSRLTDFQMGEDIICHCGVKMNMVEGCVSCPSCGNSACNV